MINDDMAMMGGGARPAAALSASGDVKNPAETGSFSYPARTDQLFS